MDEFALLAIGAALGLLAGVALGGWLVELKWRNNASQPFRIYSGSRLFKVITDEQHDRVFEVLHAMRMQELDR